MTRAGGRRHKHSGSGNSIADEQLYTSAPSGLSELGAGSNVAAIAGGRGGSAYDATSPSGLALVNHVEMASTRSRSTSAGSSPAVTFSSSLGMPPAASTLPPSSSVSPSQVRPWARPRVHDAPLPQSSALSPPHPIELRVAQSPEQRRDWVRYMTAGTQGAVPLHAHAPSMESRVSFSGLSEVEDGSTHDDPSREAASRGLSPFHVTSPSSTGFVSGSPVGLGSPDMGTQTFSPAPALQHAHAATTSSSAHAAVRVPSSSSTIASGSPALSTPALSGGAASGVDSSTSPAFTPSQEGRSARRRSFLTRLQAEKDAAAASGHATSYGHDDTTPTVTPTLSFTAVSTAAVAAAAAAAAAAAGATAQSRQPLLQQLMAGRTAQPSSRRVSGGSRPVHDTGSTPGYVDVSIDAAMRDAHDVPPRLTLHAVQSFAVGDVGDSCVSPEYSGSGSHSARNPFASGGSVSSPSKLPASHVEHGSAGGGTTVAVPHAGFAPSNRRQVRPGHARQANAPVRAYHLDHPVGATQGVGGGGMPTAAATTAPPAASLTALSLPAPSAFMSPTM
ncbi:MAG: hypothetical protein EOO41_02955, partial [Methanobacteriota archaeon]